MEKKLASYISQYQLFNNSERVLVAASAGVDSTVLCYLFKKINVDFGIAHCNFRLRGNESDGDELFIKGLAMELGVPFFVKNFDTEKYAGEHEISIQVAARMLRYGWLNEVMQGEGFPKLATAHHVDDNIETVLFNFAKGTGIKGMRGILPKRDGLVRPLLFATKKEIVDYAKAHKISFREDSSNATDKYTRNKIRHDITPVFESINPSFQQSAGSTISHLLEVELLYDFAIEFFRKQLLEKKQDRPGQWQINIKNLLRTPAPTTVLFEMLQPFGFNNPQVEQMLQSVHNQPGSYFYSMGFSLLVDRKFFIVGEKKNGDKPFMVEDFDGEKLLKITCGKLVFKYSAPPPASFAKNENTAYFDAAKIQWPLTLRHWSAGDSFKPLGMNGQRKKLQDFFSNKKLSRSEKEEVWIMESGGKICWLVGMRIDDRFKVTAGTVRCLVVEFLPNNFAT